MQPQSYGPGPNNQYDFIVNPGKPSKRSFVPSFGSGASFTQKLIFIVGGAVILIIIMWIVGSLLGGGGGDTATVTKFVQQEQEIARVAGQGAEAGRADIRNLAVTVQLSLTSQQNQWERFLANNGTELKSELKSALQNDTTDQKLTAAKTNNTFDKTFLDIMQSYLNDYASTMQSKIDTSRSDTEQEILARQYEQVKLLLEQIPKS